MKVNQHKINATSLSSVDSSESEEFFFLTLQNPSIQTAAQDLQCPPNHPYYQKEEANAID